MSGPTLAALTLAVAVLVGVSPRRRLGPTGQVTGRRAGRLPLVGAAVSGAVLAAVTLPLSTWLAGAVLAGTVALRQRRRLLRGRSAAESKALEAALDVLVGELRAGAHPLRAFAVAAGETSHPAVAAGLHGVAARARLGADVAGGLRDVAQSSALPDCWDRLAVYWELGGRHGLAIATLMQAAQREISTRRQFSHQVAATMAGARSSATLLGALPALGVLLGQLIGARPVGFLLAGPGGTLSLVGVSLVCAGLLWSDRITTQAGGAR